MSFRFLRTLQRSANEARREVLIVAGDATRGRGLGA